MTVIAYRDGTLAADSLATSNGMRDSLVVKIRKIGPLLVAGAGNGAICEKFAGWVQKGMRGDCPWDGKDSGNSIIVTPDDKIVMFGEDGSWMIHRPFYAFGSGGELAMGALMHGASAEEAVKYAIEMNVYCGGPVRVLRR